jgi:5-methylcytosine-specific restriction endonuclease McrA
MVSGTFAGSRNPNWKGGLIPKTCAICGKAYQVKRVHSSSRYCSLKCVGISQRGRSICENVAKVTKACEICKEPYTVFRSHAHRHRCCSKRCSFHLRSIITKDDANPNWNGGLSRLPYPWNFKDISRRIIERDNGVCQNTHNCSGSDHRMTAHHINYDKLDCRDENLICLCSSCNSKANFDRAIWMMFYQLVMLAKKDGGGWEEEEF